MLGSNCSDGNHTRRYGPCKSLCAHHEATTPPWIAKTVTSAHVCKHPWPSLPRAKDNYNRYRPECQVFIGPCGKFYGFCSLCCRQPL